ncbi:oxidoreductase [Aureimonas flava]|uniref:Oxidoreductase n=1 Tax=Aureimonas flava TaxID=2320271 RepID=A0A3A1WU44_9HYPH|nr:FAD-dependent oxidoreductase [Aureimonas flava]RIY01943.1 oxidoreductase [Aureimonas flava]
MRHDVLALADLPADGLAEVSVGELKILLARDGDRVLATGATCTHKGAPLKNGRRVGNRVICPWHHAIFDLETGDHREPPGKGCLSRFSAAVENGRVLVEVPEDARAHRPEVDAPSRESRSERVFAIVGGGAAGLACAEELARRGFGGRIVLFLPEREPPYDRTDLSKAYLQGKKTDDALALQPPEALEALGFERVETAVERIDAAARRIHLANGETLDYDRCFAAPGSGAVPLDMAGADAENVVSLRSHDDARRLKPLADKARKVVVIGSGFIGMEVAASLVSPERSVTVVSRAELPFAKQFGDDVARQLLATHRAKGVDVRTSTDLAALETEAGRVVAVRFEDGSRCEADLVIAALGAAPRADLLAGVERAGKGVKVDATLKAAEGLYAGGDIAAFPLAATGESARIEHWRVAEQHGRHAAGAMLGDEAPFAGIPFFWTAQHGRLSYVGHAETFDAVHVEGSLADNSYTAFYVKDGRVLAGLGLGKGDRTPALHALMLGDPAPESARLEAAGWDPAALLQPR